MGVLVLGACKRGGSWAGDHVDMMSDCNLLRFLC